MTLFNNPAVQRMRTEMTKEDREKMEKIGQRMYGNIDFENNSIDNTLDMTYRHLVAALNSGLTIDDLDDDERGIMQAKEGAYWEKKWQR